MAYPPEPHKKEIKICDDGVREDWWNDPWEIRVSHDGYTWRAAANEFTYNATRLSAEAEWKQDVISIIKRKIDDFRRTKDEWLEMTKARHNPEIIIYE